MNKYHFGGFLWHVREPVYRLVGLGLTAYGTYSGNLVSIAGGVGLLYASKVCIDESQAVFRANELNNIALALKEVAAATKKPDNSDGLVEIARSIDGLARKLDKKE